MKQTPLQPWIERKIGLFPGMLDKNALRTYQLDKINQIVTLARERSIFYREHLGKAPGVINNWEDFTRLPFMAADDLRKHPLKMVCVSQNEIERVVTLETSGTSGEPKRVYFTREDQDLTIDFFGVGMTSLVSPADRVLILLPGATPGSVGDLLQIGLARVGIFSLKHGPVKDIPSTLAAIREENITCLVGVPSQVLALARWEELIKEEERIQLRSVLLSTDHVPMAITAGLQNAWGCAVFNHYGMTEMGLGGGVSCEAQRGYHLREADMYFEVINPDTGQPLPEGEIGEVVFTTLTRRGMPFIRYKTGDLSRFIPGECPCRTSLNTLEFIRTRMANNINLGVGILSLADLDEAVFGISGVVNFKAYLSGNDVETVLHIELQVFEEQNRIEEFVRRELESVPVLKLMLDCDHISFVIRQTIIHPNELGPMAKRSLLDMRKG